MANVGSLNWLVKMEKAARAKSKAKEVTDEFDEMGDKARQADRAVEDLNDSTDNAGGKLSGMGRRLGLTTGMLGLFTSGLLGAGNALLRLLGISIGGGALGSLVTWLRGLTLTGAVAWLKGLAATIGGFLLTALGKVAYAAGAVVGFLEGLVAMGGAAAAAGWALAVAIGAVIGLFGVWILKITGVLDWIGSLGEALGNSLPGWARDGLLAVLSIFTGFLAVLGAAVIGFIEGGFQGAWNKAKQVVMIFVGAWKRLFRGAAVFVMRQLTNIKNFFAGILNAGINAAKNIASWFDTKISNVVSWVSGLETDFWNLVDAVADFFENVAPQPLKDAFNWVVDKVNDLIGLVEDLIDRLQGVADGVANAADAVPGSDLAGAAGRAGGDAVSWAAGGLGDAASGEVNLPSLQSGGTVRDSGIARVHAGEVVGEPGALLEAAGMSGGDSGSGGKTLIIKEQIIEIGDQTLDISELGRAEMEELASLISEKQHNTFQSATF